MPRQSFLLHIALIKDLLAKRKWSQEEFAHTCGIDPSRVSRLLDATLPLEERDRASLKTLAKIAAKLGYTGDGEHMLLTLHQDGTPYTSIGHQVNALPKVLVDPEPVGVTTQSAPGRLVIVISGPEAAITLLTLVQWNEIIKHLISSVAGAIATNIRKGSLVLTIEADDAAIMDVIESFLAWRLQHIGVYEVIASISAERTPAIIRTCVSHFRFPDDYMRERCRATLIAQREATVSTREGVQAIQLNPLHTLYNVADSAEGAWEYARSARQSAAECLDIVGSAGVIDTYRFYDALGAAVSHWQFATDAWLVVCDAGFEPAQDASGAAANAASTLRRILDGLLSLLPHGFSEKLRASMIRRIKAVSEEAWKLSDNAWQLMDTLWFKKNYDVWELRSTMSPRQIRTAHSYWSYDAPDDVYWKSAIPDAARFPETPISEPQPAILLDDETLSTKLQQQPS